MAAIAASKALLLFPGLVSGKIKIIEAYLLRELNQDIILERLGEFPPETGADANGLVSSFGVTGLDFGFDLK